jgi:thiosulfate reductase cytochrome b subunit
MSWPMTDLTPAAATTGAGSRPLGAQRRLRTTRRSLVDFWLDLVLLIAFTLDYSFQFTGLPVHEWIGLVFVVLIPVHLVQHWDWVMRTTRRLVHSRRGREALRWIVDLLLMPVMVLCVASGVLISQSALPWLGITMANDGFWRGLHTTSADVTVALVAVHVALSWRWIWSIMRRLAGRRSAA